MLTGTGASITKVTICILVGIVTLIGGYIFLFQPARIAEYKDYALSVTPLIGILIGGYATGTTFQRIQKK
jgi:type II secretory pathway component PulF